MAVGLGLVVGLTGCAAKTAPGERLSIQPQVQVDIDGKAVPATDAASAADPAGNGQASCPPHTTIGYAGPLTGQDSALGINIVDAVRVALARHNSANPNCQVQLKQFDTEGKPQKASQVVPQIINDAAIVGLVGPTFSGETKATGQILSDAGLISMTASATNATLTQKGWKTFFRGLANDDVQGPSVAKYLRESGYKRVCVILDNTDYGAGLARSILAGLGDASRSDCVARIKKGDRDFSATVTRIAAIKPDAIFFAGYYAEAATLVQQLKSAGVTATFVSADGTNDPQFLRQGGNSTKNSVLSCPCGPAPERFAEEYRRLNHIDPGVYSVEGYDLATIVLKGIDAGRQSRPALVDFVRSYSGDGLARHYQWSPNGELAKTNIWIYDVSRSTDKAK
ncbi:MAG: branched-chain amino acid ABC transporter substrate-binding protein [Mycobacteriaceae bacterium]|nr:branched-chain amino acid ABC transporter substrate-binding protein [Mycobacteriaceae bacterium]